MLAEIITIGDEILIGQVVDTNSAWISQQFNLIGIRVKQISSVSDSETHILMALREASERADIIIITGGLGPTKDDITKTTLCKYFNTRVKFDALVYQDVEKIFKNRGREVTEINRKQAEVPENCIALRNSNGTAPGMWFEEKGKIYIAMPGVPFEMKGLMEKYVLPRLKEKLNLPEIVHKTILTQGIGESFLSEKIADWESSLEKESIKLAYLPSPGMVRLRLSAYSGKKEENEKNIEQKTEELKKIIPGYIYGYDEDTLEEIIACRLREKKQTLSIAESCTGGYISHLITRIPGSSDYFKGSVISYANEIKTAELGVNENDISAHGAVSQQVVEQMAEGIRKKFKTDYAIATSGIAGPSGGSVEKPVGTVWIAVASADKITSRKFNLGENRERIIQIAGITALNMLRKEISE